MHLGASPSHVEGQMRAALLRLLFGFSGSPERTHRRSLLPLAQGGRRKVLTFPGWPSDVDHVHSQGWTRPDRMVTGRLPASMTTVDAPPRAHRLCSATTWATMAYG
jgi:hypothetical protein